MADKYIFIEQWKSKPAWLTLAPEARRAYADRIVQASSERPDGVRAIAWGLTDKAVAHSVGHDFWAVWELDGEAMAQGFMQGVDASGWYQYFEQANTLGVAQSAAQVLDLMVGEATSPLQGG